MARLREHVARLEMEADDYPVGADTHRAADALDDVDDRLRQAVNELGERPTSADRADRAIDHIKDARRELDRASRELEKL